MVNMKISITKEQYILVNGDIEGTQKLAAMSAVNEGYYPETYGLFNAKVLKEGLHCFISWDRLSSCD